VDLEEDRYTNLTWLGEAGRRPPAGESSGMRTKILLVALVALGALAPASASPVVVLADPWMPRCVHDFAWTHDHARSGGHEPATCGMKRLAELEVSKGAGLGQVEIHKDTAAVLQRDEGVVSLIDVKDPRKPKVLGRYRDDIADSFDGDLAFSRNGKWLFYARQTHQFSKDGVHVLDVSDPKQPRLAFYQPQGGTFRIGYLNHAGGEYVITMDAIAGLVVNRFEPTTGALVPVFVDALPALKVGGPSSAGVYVDPKDPKLGVPLLYATNGRTGLDVYDMSDPMAPAKVGSWNDAGLSDVEVIATKKRRLVLAASEYWFQSATPASVWKLDATKLDRIKTSSKETGAYEAAEPWRVGGIEIQGSRVHVAMGHAGLVSQSLRGRSLGAYRVPRPVNENASLQASPYAMDVDSAGGLLYLTDAASGMLTILKPR
jgi:hypothetical protein